MARKTKKQIKLETDIIYKRLYSAILRYGSAKVILKRRDGTEYGQRLIKKSGRSKVSYFNAHNGGEGYKKNYSQSCFVEDYTEDYCPCCTKKRLNLAHTLRAMRDHDSSWIAIKSVNYGPRFKKQMKLT